MAFHVGQKVVCVDTSPTDLGFPVPMVRGRIYTVSEVRLETGGLRLNEAPMWKQHGHCDWYRATRFRPVIERTTDISIFEQMLTPNSRELCGND